MKYVKPNFSEIVNNLIIFISGAVVLFWIGGEFITFFLVSYALAFIFIELRAILLIDQISVEISESRGDVSVKLTNPRKIKAYGVAVDIAISGPQGSHTENISTDLKTFSQTYKLKFGNYFHNLFIDKGFYRISVEARISDWFNIFTQYVTSEKNFPLYPDYDKYYRNPDLLSLLLTEASERTVIRPAEKTTRGDVIDDIWDIRPFNYQDQQNRINWPLSAHVGELTVNIYENQVITDEEIKIKDKFCIVNLNLVIIRGEPLSLITKLIYDCISVINYLQNDEWEIEFHYFNGEDKIIEFSCADEICKKLLTVPYFFSEKRIGFGRENALIFSLGDDNNVRI